MVATGTSAHHAEHVLSAMLLELVWQASRAAKAGKDAERTRAVYYRKLKKLTRDSAYRKKITQEFGPEHSAFE